LPQIAHHIAVSIIIPTYNRSRFLKKAVASVIEQTGARWELIVVDDGSTDDTVEILTRFGDARIRIITLPHSGNIAALRNAGAEASAGKWIAFLDSDDEWKPDKLEIQLRALEKERKGWCYSSYEFIDENSTVLAQRKINTRSLSGWITGKLLVAEASVPISSLVVDRSLFDRTGGFNTSRELILREDYEWVLRLSLCAEALFLPEILISIREHPGRTTSAFDDGYERTVAVYRHFLQTNRDPRLKKVAKKRVAYHMAEIAAKKMGDGQFHSGWRHMMQAVANKDRLGHLLSVVRRGLYTRRVRAKGSN
jgi:glycosyltransferase involved in cell wall biosynthesis